ncbi:MAG: DUF4945 domain-containing protein [Tannerella sp.]|jgi:hypothetical protein|nr:DUF4945 domain-containing protein [Tannerella sp.]
MKKLENIFVAIATVLIYTSCYDREIVSSKEGVSLPPATNLSHIISGNKITLTWQIPSGIPSEMNRPLGVNIQILRCLQGSLTNVRIFNSTFQNEPTEVILDMPSNPDGGIYEYHIVVKLTGTMKEPEYGHSGTIYSLGRTVVVK